MVALPLVVLMEGHHCDNDLDAIQRAAILDELVFMKQPQGFEDSTDRACLLQKSVYGLCQRSCLKKKDALFAKIGYIWNKLYGSRQMEYQSWEDMSHNTLL